MPNTEEIRDLKLTVEHLETVAQAMDRQAVSDRYTLQATIDDLRFDFKRLDEKLEMMSTIVAQQAKIIRDFEDERQRQVGSKGMLRLLWGVLGTGIAAIAYSIHDVISLLSRK